MPALHESPLARRLRHSVAMACGGLAFAGCSLGLDDYRFADTDELSEAAKGDGEDAAVPAGGGDGGGGAGGDAASGANAGDGGGVGAPEDGGTDAGCDDATPDPAGCAAPEACAGSPCGDHATCAPAAEAPGYTCTCDSGYAPDDDGSCINIDECFAGTHACHLSATCVDAPGSYDCTCPLGYVGGGPNGVACTPRIIAGNAHVCVVQTSGRVQCWGSNSGGALGDGTMIDRPAPVTVVALDDVVGLAASGSSSCAILAGGQVKCWGDGQPDAQTVPGLDEVIAVSTSSGHSCAVHRDGAMRCWGDNDAGQLGTGEESDAEVTEPVLVSGLSAPAIGAAVIDRQSCAVLRSGDVQCWGTGMLGTLMLGTEMYTSSLVPVDVVTSNVTALVTGGYHWCALLGNRRLHCWGNTALIGGMGFTPEPIYINGITDVSAVDVEVYRTHVLLGDGTIRWWDAGTTPAALAGVSDTIAIAVGGRIACALLDDGTVTCWTWVNPGDVPAPTLVDGLDLW